MAQQSNRHLGQAVAVVVVVIAGIGIAYGLKSCQDRPASQDLPLLAPLVSVQIANRQDVPLVVKGFGTVRPQVSIPLVPQVHGQIIRVNPALRSGNFFQSDQVLAEIDPVDYELAIEQAQATRAQAEASLKQATASRTETEAQRDDALIEATRVRNLFSQRSASQQKLDRSELALKRARARLEVSDAERSNASAVHSLATTNLKIALLNLERTRLGVPFDGRVIDENVDVGQYVTAGQILANVYGTETMEVVLPLEDRQLAWFDPPSAAANSGGATAQLHTQFGGKSRRWSGRVVRLEGQIDPTSRMAHLVVEVDDPGSDDPNVMLMPGMFVEVHIQGRTLRDVVALPLHALRSEGTVWLVEADRLRFHEVQVVRRQQKQVYVRGINDGQLVVISSLDVISDGMHVRTVSGLSETSGP